VDQDGNKWETKMRIPYGYIRKTDGSDGEHVDCFVGPNSDARNAYIIHINDPKTGDYDEDKVFLGFDSRKAARKSFDQHYDKPERFFRGLTVMSMQKFKKHVLDKENHGEKIAAYVIQPIILNHPPSLKKGKSKLDIPERDDNSLRDFVLRQRPRLISVYRAPFGGINGL